MKKFYVLVFFIMLAIIVPHMIIASSWYICSGGLDVPADWYSDPECTSPIGGVLPGAGESVFAMQTVSTNGAIINYNLSIAPNASVWCSDCNVNGGNVTIQSEAQFDITGDSFVTNGSIQNQGVLGMNYGRAVFSSSSITISGAGGLNLSGGAELSVDTGPLILSAGNINIHNGELVNYSNSSFRKTGGVISMAGNSTIRNNNPTQYQLAGTVGGNVSFDPRTRGADSDNVNFNVLRLNTPTTWSVDAIPEGLSINSSTGQITGIPTTATSGTMYITAVQSGANTLTAVQAMTYSISNSVPASVSSPSAQSSGVTGATVTWNAPGSDGGLPILYYYITTSPGDNIATTSTTTLSILFSNLTTGTPYTFSIYAVNSAGTSSVATTSPLTLEPPQQQQSQSQSPSVPTAGGSTGASVSDSSQGQNSLAPTPNSKRTEEVSPKDQVKYVREQDVFVQNTKHPESVVDKNPEYIPEVCPAYIDVNAQFAIGIAGDRDLVKKLQTYLNTHHDAQLAVDGEYKSVDKAEYDKLVKDHATEIRKGALLTSSELIDSRAVHKYINKTYCESTKELVCPYFVMYAKKGDVSPEVLKIKKFLNNTQNENLSMNSLVFDSVLERAVKRFQRKYSDRILDPWDLDEPTGIWYQSTRSTADYILGCTNTTVLSNGKVLK